MVAWEPATFCLDLPPELLWICDRSVITDVFRKSFVHTFIHISSVMQCIMFDVTIIRAYKVGQGWRGVRHKGYLVSMRQWVDGIPTWLFLITATKNAKEQLPAL